jgi:predicted Zn-dependent peptidase
VRSAEGKAEMLGTCESIGGDMRLFTTRLAQARAVTPAQLQEVVRRQLNVENRVVVTVQPGPHAQ